MTGGASADGRGARAVPRLAGARVDGGLSAGGVGRQGVARVVDTRTNSKLTVRFAPAFLSWLPQVWGDYWVVGLADDYSWAVVGSPDRKYLWILARAAALTGEPYERALASARDNGFAVERLVTTRQGVADDVREMLQDNEAEPDTSSVTARPCAIV